jgi:hypothetical protein
VDRLRQLNADILTGSYLLSLFMVIVACDLDLDHFRSLEVACRPHHDTQASACCTQPFGLVEHQVTQSGSC